MYKWNGKQFMWTVIFVLKWYRKNLVVVERIKNRASSVLYQIGCIYIDLANANFVVVFSLKQHF